MQALAGHWREFKWLSVSIKIRLVKRSTTKLRQISRGSLVLFKSIFCTCDSLLIGFILWAWPQGVGYPKGFLNLVKIRCVLYCFALSFYCVQFLSWQVWILSRQIWNLFQHLITIPHLINSHGLINLVITKNGISIINVHLGVINRLRWKISIKRKWYILFKT